MTKTKSKKSVFPLLAVLVVLAAGGVYLYMNFGSLLTRTAEKIASNALGVSVDIGSINVSLQDKKVTVNTLEIGNPPGYKTPYAVKADSIAIGLNTASKELIDFKDIQVKGSVVNLEVNEKGSMNLNDLKTLANQKKQTESVGSEAIRVIVKHMVIDASTIKPTISLLDKDIDPITLPALTFNNIGSGSGIPVKDAIVQVMTKYLNEAQGAARRSGALAGVPGFDGVTKVIDDAKDSLKKLFQ